MSKIYHNLEEYGQFVRMMSNKSVSECASAWATLRGIFKRLHHLDEALVNGYHWELPADVAEQVEDRLTRDRDRLYEKAVKIAGDFGFGVFHSGDPRGVPHLTAEVDGYTVHLFPYLP